MSEKIAFFSPCSLGEELSDDDPRAALLEVTQVLRNGSEWPVDWTFYGAEMRRVRRHFPPPPSQGGSGEKVSWGPWGGGGGKEKRMGGNFGWVAAAAASGRLTFLLLLPPRGRRYFLRGFRRQMDGGKRKNVDPDKNRFAITMLMSGDSCGNFLFMMKLMPLVCRWSWR